MLACQLHKPAPIETNPLQLVEVTCPTPTANQLLVRVSYCGVCRTDLHVIEGELPPMRSPVIPGHQVVGRIESVGPLVTRYQGGERIGIPWLHRTCGFCRYCLTDQDNLCDRATFTGYLVDGGYAQFALAEEAFVYPIPDSFSDVEAAPLLCAGIIGFRSLRMSGIKAGQKLGFFGFGSAAHLAVQVASHWNVDVYAFSRNMRHQELARELGAVWSGSSNDAAPAELDGAIIFAPAGELVVTALKALRKGGTVVCAGIHMSPIPAIEYQWLYHERVIRSVANNTREDGDQFLRTAAEIPIKTEVNVFDLSEANVALNALKHDALRGAAVIRV